MDYDTILDLQLICYIDGAKVEAYPLDRMQPGTQSHIREVFAEVWIPHQVDGGSRYCLTCFLMGVPANVPAPAEMLVLQGTAGDLVAAFGEHAREMKT